MKKYLSLSIVALTIILASGVYGILMAKHHLFPYRLMENENIFPLNNNLNWSIGIYTGNSPFKLNNPNNINNPILTADDVTDADAQFVADPFMVKNDSLYYMFFEVLNNKNKQGDIGYASSSDGLSWDYKKIVIDEPFHLSFPYIFKWKNEYYLIPESNNDLSVRLYKAISFPEKWTYVKNLINGYHFADPQIIHYNNMWWLFVTTNEDDNLNVYYSHTLNGEWTQHPLSPVVKGNKHFARGGGRVVDYNGKIYRYTQDCSTRYGVQVFAFEITQLDTLHYNEKMVQNKPIIKADPKGSWNSLGMHTVDPIQLKTGEWISTVDGYSSG